MIKNYLELGQIVSTHGIKGEVRFDPWCDSPEFVKKFKTLYFDADGERPVKVISARPHGNIAILMLDGVTTVDEARALRGTVLYMKRSDAHLPKGTWFIQELIGCTVSDADTDRLYGEITDVIGTGANDVYCIKTPSGEVLFPAVKEFIVSTDVENGTVKIRPIKGMFSDED